MKSINSMNKMFGMNATAGTSAAVSMGESTMSPELSFNPTVREVNQMKTANQVASYEASKQMASQSRTDMSGNVNGFGDTLG